MVEIDQWSKPNIEQFAELVMGMLPREFHSTDDLTPQARTVYEAGQRLWARPAAGNFNDSETPESWHQRADALKEKHNNGNGAGTPLAIQAKETVGRLWMRPAALDSNNAIHFKPVVRHPNGVTLTHMKTGKKAQETVGMQAISLTGRLSPTTRTDGEPSSTPDLTSLRLNPLFDEWLLFGARMIGWTCVCPSRVLVRADGALPPSEMQCAQIKPPQPSGHFGSEHSESGRHE